MNTKGASVDYGSEGQEIKGLIEVSPAIRVAILFIDLI